MSFLGTSNLGQGSSWDQVISQLGATQDIESWRGTKGRLVFFGFWCLGSPRLRPFKDASSLFSQGSKGSVLGDDGNHHFGNPGAPLVQDDF